MVVVQHRGRLGNQMFQYAAGRIIAEAKGYKLATIRSDDIILESVFPNAAPLTEGIETHDNALTFGLHSACPTIQHLDMDAAIKHNGKIFLGGYWQKHYLYTPHIEKIRKWFEYDESSYEKPGADDIVVYVRLGDYLTCKWYLTPKIYIDIVKTMGPYNRCIIQTDSPEAPVLNEFKRLENVVINNTGLLADFTMLKHAKRLVLSQSSFGFWAAFLGNPDVVYAPLNENRAKPWWPYTPELDDTDLVPNDPKYIKVKV